MTYAIIGSGSIGHALATQFARKRIEVQIANSRGAESLADMVRELGPGIVAMNARDALRADVVILAVPFPAIPGVVRGAPAWSGRIVVDASNAIDFPAFTPTDLGGRPSTEVVADIVPGALVVKAFNTIRAPILATDPTHGDGRRVVALSGNDAKANSVVAALIEQLGFAALRLGDLAQGSRLQQLGGAVHAVDLIRLG
jgi:predicted dinucleotide-binding enzyme